MNLRNINIIAWKLVKKFAVAWGTAFRTAQKLLCARKWKGLRFTIRRHFQRLSDAYRALGDSGRFLAFSRSARIALSSETYHSFRDSSYIGPSSLLEVWELSLCGHSTRLRTLGM